MAFDTEMARERKDCVALPRESARYGKNGCALEIGRLTSDLRYQTRRFPTGFSTDAGAVADD